MPTSLKRSFGDELDPKALNKNKKIKLAGADESSSLSITTPTSGPLKPVAIFDEQNQEHISPTTSFDGTDGGPPLPYDPWKRDLTPAGDTPAVPSASTKTKKTTIPRAKSRRNVDKVTTSSRPKDSIASRRSARLLSKRGKADIPQPRVPELPLEVVDHIIDLTVMSNVEDQLAGRRVSSKRNSLESDIVDLALVSKMFFCRTFRSLSKALPKAEEEVKHAMALADSRTQPAAIFPPYVGYSTYVQIKNKKAAAFKNHQELIEQKETKRPSGQQCSHTREGESEIDVSGALGSSVALNSYTALDSDFITQLPDRTSYQSTLGDKMRLIKALSMLLVICDSAEVLLSTVRPDPHPLSPFTFRVDDKDFSCRLFRVLLVELHFGGTDAGGIIMPEYCKTHQPCPTSTILQGRQLQTALQYRRRHRQLGTTPLLNADLYTSSGCDCRTCEEGGGPKATQPNHRRRRRCAK